MADESTEGTHVALPRVWEFPERSTAEATQRLNAAGPGARLLILRVDHDGVMFLKLRILRKDDGDPATESHEPDINESHPCPPFTGCGGGG